MSNIKWQEPSTDGYRVFVHGAFIGANFEYRYLVQQEKSENWSVIINGSVDSIVLTMDEGIERAESHATETVIHFGQEMRPASTSMMLSRINGRCT